ncbi:transmembrane emp24 domain-containing protein 3-like [Mobula hypostoma]|uniref:transmembrane emp24 domain-containing protein 3-like n=1 Tax=Mobula hypostoma TaxID=723540 RepID=UPI002FC2D27B
MNVGFNPDRAVLKIQRFQQASRHDPSPGSSSLRCHVRLRRAMRRAEPVRTRNNSQVCGLGASRRPELSPASAMITLIFLLLPLPPLALASLSKFAFVLAGGDVQCFFEEIEKDTEYHFVFQVIAGGHYDVDCFIEDPKGQLVYRKHKIHQEKLKEKAEMSGVYKFCFGNQFSSFTQKKIIFLLKIGKMSPVVSDDSKKPTALTQLESSCTTIYYSLRHVIDLQSLQRLQALIDWLHAGSINTQVLYWAVSQTVSLLLVTIGQVIVLKRFFTEKRASVCAAGTRT